MRLIYVATKCEPVNARRHARERHKLRLNFDSIAIQCAHGSASDGRYFYDRVGARENIDWHALSYDAAFMPARRAIATLLLREAEFVPESTNLR